MFRFFAFQLNCDRSARMYCRTTAVVNAFIRQHNVDFKTRQILNYIFETYAIFTYISINKSVLFSFSSDNTFKNRCADTVWYTWLNKIHVQHRIESLCVAMEIRWMAPISEIREKCSLKINLKKEKNDKNNVTSKITPYTMFEYCLLNNRMTRSLFRVIRAVHFSAIRLKITAVSCESEFN